MIERRNKEITLLRAAYGAIEVGENSEWVIIREWRLPPGWNSPSTELLVIIPPGYPVTPPDNFYAYNDLRLADGRIPGNATANHNELGMPWLQFSFHVEKGDWRPSAGLLDGHTLETFLRGVGSRLAELS
jgi:hypothetical protein